MPADEFPLQLLNLGGQRHVAQASRKPVDTDQELTGQAGPRVGLVLGSLSEVGRHAAPLLILYAALAVVVTSPIIPLRSQTVDRKAIRPRSRERVKGTLLGCDFLLQKTHRCMGGHRNPLVFVRLVSRMPCTRVPERYPEPSHFKL